MFRAIPLLSLEFVLVVDHRCVHVREVVKQGGWSFHCVGYRRIEDRAFEGASLQPGGLGHCLRWMYFLNMSVIVKPVLDHANMVWADVALALVLEASTGGLLGSSVGNGQTRVILMLICHCFIHEKIVRETHRKLEAVARVKLLDLLLQIS